MISAQQFEKLETLYGSPLYLFDRDKFVDNYKRFENTFKRHYQNYRIAYSYKTNYAPYICALVKELGGYAEVVSDMEYYMAKKIGYDNKHIIYNGPYKGKLAAEHFMNGGIINVDNAEELTRWIQTAGEHSNQAFQLAIRVNIDVGQPFVSRFGIDETELDDVFARIEKINNISVSGLHCHVGQSRSVSAWRKRAEQMVRLADRYFQEPPRFIDLGSGMYGEMDERLAVQFGTELPQYEEYAAAVADVVYDHYKEYGEDQRPLLFTEPGTTLVNKYVDFAARVQCIKAIKGKQFIILNCSKHNLGEICQLKQLPIEILHCGEGRRISCKNSDITGYTCLEHDVVYRGFSGDIAVGDRIVFHNVGGYSNVSKPPFILPNCAMVTATDEPELIKRAENYEDIFQTYSFPRNEI